VLTLIFAGVLVATLVATFAPAAFLHQVTVFSLACAVGWLVIWRVHPALHTPLMSLTNAISGIVLVGALHQFTARDPLASTLGWFGILLATCCIVGGFLLTGRMIRLFRPGRTA